MYNELAICVDENMRMCDSGLGFFLRGYFWQEKKKPMASRRIGVEIEGGVW